MLLMHKNKPAGTLAMRGSVISGVNIINKDEFPVGVDTRPGLVLQSLRKWFSSRSIPQERQGISDIEKALGCSIEDAQVRAMQVSLTDCYWIRPEDSSLKWEDVNYHDNGYSEQLFSVVIEKENVVVDDFRIPDLTTDGALEKTWVHSDDKPFLLKRGNLNTLQKDNLLSANEVIASKIARRLSFDEVPYTIAKVGKNKEKMCACPCFITDSNEEYISAFDIAYASRSFGMDLYDKFKHYGFEESLKDMIYLDHLIHNTDRHERNFGIIRNAETNEILRMAPIFDSGTCLNCTGMDLSYKNDCKPFFDNRYEQLDMLSTTDIRKRHNIDIAQIQQLIQDVYERFNIAETQYEKAIECIKLSHKELTEKSKTRIMEEPTI